MSFLLDGTTVKILPGKFIDGNSTHWQRFFILFLLWKFGLSLANYNNSHLGHKNQ